MNPDMNLFNIGIDHVKPNCMFDTSKDEELRESFTWKNLQPQLKKVHSQKVIKYKYSNF